MSTPLRLALVLVCAGVCLGTVPAWASCEGSVSVVEIEAMVQQAEQSAGRSADTFGTAASALEGALPCLDRLVSPALAARIHRVRGLQAFVAGSGRDTLAAFAASRRLDAELGFPPTVFPHSHPVSRFWAQAADLGADLVPLTQVSGTVTWLDGERATFRLDAFPAVVQLQQGERVVVSAYTWPDDLLPTAPAVVQSPSGGGLVAAPTGEGTDLGHHIDVPKAGRDKAHLPLAVSAGLSALAGGVSYALALNTAADYRNNDHSDRELEQLRGRANNMVYVSLGLGGVALGTGVGAAATWPR